MPEYDFTRSLEFQEKKKNENAGICTNMLFQVFIQLITEWQDIVFIINTQLDSTSLSFLFLPKNEMSIVGDVFCLYSGSLDTFWKI